MDHEHNQTQLERLTFFSDAVFAIAITLLVIEVRLPEIEHLSDRDLGLALVNLLPKYIGFASSFFVIGRFWVGHHQLFGYLHASSGRLVWSNLFLLFSIAFMPFPTAVFSEYVQLRVGVALYTGWFGVVALLNWYLTRVALADPALLRPDVPAVDLARRRHGALIPLLIAAMAFLAGMVTPLLALVALAAGSPLIAYGVRRLDRAGPPADKTDKG